jgi:transcriptional regulator with XRE-family HTH domain
MNRTLFVSGATLTTNMPQPKPKGDDQAKLRSNIRVLRRRLGMTQQHIADELHITRVAYGRFENGKRRLRLSEIETLSFFFRVGLRQLTGTPATSDGEVAMAMQPSAKLRPLTIHFDLPPPVVVKEVKQVVLKKRRNPYASNRRKKA